MKQARIIVALVEVLENCGEDLWLFVWKEDATARLSEVYLLASLYEERRVTEDILVSGEQPFILANDNRDDCAVQTR